MFGGERVRAIRDLRGRKVAVPELGNSHHIFTSMMASHVGLDPRKDIEWVLQPPAESKKLLAEAEIDALMAFPPDAQELRAKKVGHVVVSSAIDRPWSQYFCGMIAANKEFVRKQLPGMNGIETLKHLRADADTRDIPVMAVTASAMTQDRQKIMATGFDAYQSKPINVREFVEAVRAVLATRGPGPPCR